MEYGGRIFCTPQCPTGITGQPVSRAISKGLYAPWLPSAGDVARLEQIFPSGVCDYSKPDVGRPKKFNDDDDD